MSESYRILSIESCYVYAKEQENGVGVGYQLPPKGTDAYFWQFKNKLDASLDAIELKRVYEEIYKAPFSFDDKYGNAYTLAVVNLKFGRKPDGININTLELREHFYENGFYIEGIRYVRYKRSAGSSRNGTCLFIDERLYEAMAEWGECGLSAADDLASWEAYKSLSLSSIKGTVRIPLEGILFVPDYKASFRDEVVSVELEGGALTATVKETEITNDIWDGESLLDESLFTGEYAEKHMLLLRNKFFKSCGFRTKLQKWIEDKAITLEALKERGFVTFATDIRQIVMVTTPNSLKYLKIAKGQLAEEDIRPWTERVDGTFGVVKWDKRTRFFGGRMVRSSYQLLNTIGLSEEQADKLMQASTAYLETIRKDIDFMRYHFSDVCAKESDEEERSIPDGIAERADVIFRLMNTNNEFQRTALYSKFRNDMVKNQKDGLLEGHILLSGTNATLFGNGPELLKYIAGEEPVSVLKPNQIWCGKFENGQKLLCARSPHVTMGNLYSVENNLDGEIWSYFDLGENIVCVNAIGENIQQRLNGCDYDSDTMLITDDAMLIETAEKYKHLFKVPVCKIEPSGSAKHTLTELDYNTSNNQIGQIVNLAQQMNSIIWDRLNKGDNDIEDVYLDVCKLAVLSGLEIDKAKRAYDSVRVAAELNIIRNKYDYLPPEFFKTIHNAYAQRWKTNNKSAKGTPPAPAVKPAKKKEYASYDTGMEYIYKIASAVDFRKDKPKLAEYIPISSMLNFKSASTPADCVAAEEIIGLCDRYKDVISSLYLAMRKADANERDVIYDRIRDVKSERDEKISKLITNENILFFVITHFETRKTIDWHIYAPLLNSDTFGRIFKESRERLADVYEDPSGEYSLYGFRYSKK